MTESDAESGDRGGWRCANLWAREDNIDGNRIRQLRVPSSRFDRVSGEPSALTVSNEYGAWDAATVDRPLDAGALWVRLPVGAKPGDGLSHATWNAPAALQLQDPADVLASYDGAIAFSGASDSRPGLRTPQLGALHAVLGYWTTNQKQPATVVMPTGTGKTETMLALLVAAKPERLLVLVPSDSLRDQIAGKFETLGVLQELGIVSNVAARPVVGRVAHGFSSISQAVTFAGACNVIVATPQSLSASDQDAIEAMVGACSHLFVDEAHHVAARTWTDIRERFAEKNVVQFTATPFREDGKHLQGRTIYSFPLREAQAQNYFSKINYKSVIDFDNVDLAVATQSVERLRADLDSNFDHVLMARVSGIPRAMAILPIYQHIAADLNPVIINSQMSKKHQREALRAVRARDSHIIICVNMLGEGFDLPALKIAAVHDPQKSLGVTLQFIGRFARTSSTGKYGEASMFVARSEMDIDRRLRELYAEDSDWNLIVRDLSEAAVQEQHEISDFEAGFTSRPPEVDLRSLLPKMSTVVYRAPTAKWEPHNVVEFFGEENFYTFPIGLNQSAGVAWFVIENRDKVRWGDLKTIEEVSYQLYVLYFNEQTKLLYINNSANDGVFEELAEAVLGSGAQRFTGSSVYRAMADIDRLVPTNVGVLDAHNQFRRFSMHVGPDVTESFSQAEASTKSQTNISGSGYRDGEIVNISASLKGRIWSHATASTIKEWCDWCDSIGKKLLDETISIDKVIGQFILPEELTSLPSGVLLAVEWPWLVHTLQADSMRLSHAGSVYQAVFTDLVPEVGPIQGAFRFTVRSGSWSVPYEASVESGRIVYRCTDKIEIVILRAGSEVRLSDWLNKFGLLFILDGDRIIENDLLYQPKWDRTPYERQKLTVLDWGETKLNVESQTRDKLQESIQYRALVELRADTDPWDLIIDDDGKGEIADLVAMRIDPEGLLVKLIHCKYAHEGKVGARLADLYEVCGQAQKSVVWRRSDLGPFFRTLHDRARKKNQRDGVSPFEVGDIRKLYEVRDRATILRRRMEIVIAQPGLSRSKATIQQLDLLASTEAYLRTTVNAPLAIWCSA
ncbi:DEAD/DEAH box helicase family protein [Kribbella sp. NBC_00709]|uniref:DEAD/DEAH box helicase n=1 Tax=Kribbella sp. NBC_00709 TaxID=2975972 RepID=UPI002E2BD6AF|nr:DEAD/DEAH box helicase family protein [Kribbella sp. NBC_00709]